MTKSNFQGTPGFNVGNDPPPWSKPAPDRSLLDNFELIQDLARYGEGLFTRDQVKKKWRKLIIDEMWDTIGSDDQLVDAIEAEKVRRDRLDRRRPPVKKKTEPQPQEQAGILLNWLLRWPKPELTLSDVRNYAPRPIRKKEIAFRSAQILAAQGHLTPLATTKWRIIRQPLTPPLSR